jgi:hypothetical protein
MLSAWRTAAGAATAAALVLASLPARSDDAVSLVEVNGVPFAVTERTLRIEPEQAARNLQARWGRETPSTWIESARVGERRIVARRRGPLLETASFRPATGFRGSRVVISVFDMRASPGAAPPAPVAAPPASRWLSSTRSLDAAAEATVEWLALTDRPVQVAFGSWRAALRLAGWRELPGPAVLAAVYERGGETLSLHLQPLGAQTVVVVQCRRGSGS